MKIINNFVRTCCETAADIDRPFGNIEFEIGEIYLFHKIVLIEPCLGMALEFRHRSTKPIPSVPTTTMRFGQSSATATQTASCSSRAPTI